MTYIQSDNERKLAHNFDAACALYGALENAQNIRLTSIDEVLSGKFDSLIRKHLFAGSVDYMQTVFSRAGVKIPSVHNLNQNYIVTSLYTVREKIALGETWFVKPTSAKLFTGMVFNSATISQLLSHSGETEVLISKPFESNIINEVRCYVFNNKIIDTRNYTGDFRKTPDWNWVDNIVARLQNAPVAYTIDIAVLENGDNVIIEYNDMWAIGNYGLDNSIYYQLLSARYFEIMKSDQK